MRNMGLVAEHTNLIWLLIHRFNVSDRITPDEMYQIALQEVNNAINRHNCNREGRTARFKNWLFLHIRSKFICLFKIELNFVQRNERYRTQLINTNSFANEETPLKVAIEADLREQIKQVVMSTLDEGQATTIKAYFFEGLQYVSIAHRLGEKPGTIEMRSTRGRKKLKENPRLQELAQEYFA
jgi:RNA polymerase sigma factor (sigma-70 family)